MDADVVLGEDDLAIERRGSPGSRGVGGVVAQVGRGSPEETGESHEFDDLDDDDVSAVAQLAQLRHKMGSIVSWVLRLSHMSQAGDNLLRS